MYLLIHAPLWKISFLPLGINYQTVLSLALCPYDETFVVNLLVNILCFPKEKPENKSYYYSGKTSLGTVNRLFQKDRKITRLNSSHVSISYAVFCLKKKTKINMV